MLEKVTLDFENENFLNEFEQCLITNSLFNEKKIVSINLSKNRLNKDLKKSFSKIFSFETQNLIVVETQNLTKKTIEKELMPLIDSNVCAIDCYAPYDSEISLYLKDNLPKNLSDSEYIQNLLEMYENNFSALINDLEILEILNIQDKSEASNIFSESGSKNNYKLIEYLSKGNVNSALDIVISMKNNDRNSIALLIWILARDLNALKYLKQNKNLKNLGIWDSQLKWYSVISKKVSNFKLKELSEHLDSADKKFKGYVKGDPWLDAKNIVLELAV
tara:strand:- start:8 stop:835 length:828 start_codon:yes stop_codon:yes gene_type:complete